MTFVLATRNRHKAEEIRSILGQEFEYHALDEFPEQIELIEDAETFAGNAIKKAVQLSNWSGLRAPSSPVASQILKGELYVLADDSGLEVDALAGAPGVRSARFAASDLRSRENTPDTKNNTKLLRLLRGIPPKQRQARFKCVIALTPVLRQHLVQSPVCLLDEAELKTETFEGSCEGTIALAPRGQAGFGYDPLFVPNGFKQSFAELSEQTKNQISHRARALEKLKARLSGRPA